MQPTPAAQLRMAQQRIWNALLPDPSGIIAPTRRSRTGVSPQFATAMTQSRSGEDRFAPLRFLKLGPRNYILIWGAKLALAGARCEQMTAALPTRHAAKGAGVGAIAATTMIMAMSAASPAAAAYSFWYGSPYRHHATHQKIHKDKTADRPGKDPLAEAKAPLQIFISINQQKLHVYSGGVHVAETSIATGVASHPTPLGVFSVIQKQIFHRSNLYSSAPMPYMQRVTWSGVAMHEGQNIGHPASHGCIRMPHDFAVRLYRLTKLNTRVVIARSELKPVDFADAHLFVHKEATPEIAALPSGLTAAVADPAEIAAQAGGAPGIQPVQVDAPPLSAPAAAGPSPEQKAVRAGAGDAPAGAAVMPPAPPTPADLAKAAAAKKKPVSIFVSRKRQRLYVRQDFEPLFDVAITIAQPELPVGTHVFTAMDFTGSDRTTMRWNVISMPAEAAKRVHYVEGRNRHGERVRRREIVEEERDAPSPQTPAQVLDRIEIPPELIDAISQMIVPGSSLIVSDQGLGDETGEDTDFVVVTK
jgi:lipoprotein-anchoring transpeptidase ErfK/SrfK